MQSRHSLDCTRICSQVKAKADRVGHPIAYGRQEVGSCGKKSGIEMALLTVRIGH